MELVEAGKSPVRDRRLQRLASQRSALVSSDDRCSLVHYQPIDHGWVARTFDVASAAAPAAIRCLITLEPCVSGARILLEPSTTHSKSSTAAANTPCICLSLQMRILRTRAVWTLPRAGRPRYTIVTAESPTNVGMLFVHTVCRYRSNPYGIWTEAVAVSAPRKVG